MTPSAKLVAAVKAAFADLGAPPADGISEVPWNDEGTTEFFTGKPWQGHTPEALNQHSFALLAFTPEAFHYYLPAFLIASLEAPDEAPVDSVISAISPPKDNPKRPSFWRRWSLFSPTQRRVIVECLKYWSGEGYVGISWAAARSLEATIDA
jgi:hypothetical protein